MANVWRAAAVAGDHHVAAEGDSPREVEARARLDALLERTRETAYAEGYAAGRRVGMAEATQALQAPLALLANAAEAVVAARTAALAAAEADAVALAVEVAGRIVHKNVEADRQLALGTVREALRRVADRTRLTIRVNPEDLALVAEHRAEWVEMIGASGVVDVVADRRVPRGGTEVISPSGIVDARLGSMLDEARRLAESPLVDGEEDLPL